MLTRTNPNQKSLRGILSKSYRKSHDRLGASDIIGYQKSDGKFIAIEVKVGKDKLSTLQIRFLQDVRNGNGLAIEARTMNDVIEGVNRNK